MIQYCKITVWTFYKDSYNRLKFHIFAWLGLNPDYAPEEYTRLLIFMKFFMLLTLFTIFLFTI
jgi:hypothetical protein